VKSNWLPDRVVIGPTPNRAAPTVTPTTATRATPTNAPTTSEAYFTSTSRVRVTGTVSR